MHCSRLYTIEDLEMHPSGFFEALGVCVLSLRILRNVRPRGKLLWIGRSMRKIDNFIPECLIVPGDNVKRAQISQRSLEDWRHEGVRKLSNYNHKMRIYRMVSLVGCKVGAA